MITNNISKKKSHKSIKKEIETDRITSHVKVSIGRTTLVVVFDDLELQAFEDELKHLIRDECKSAPELRKVRSITLRHSLCHIDCIKKQKSSALNASTVGKDVSITDSD